MNSRDRSKLLSEFQPLKSGLGAVAWTALEMFKGGGMNEESPDNVKESMKTLPRQALRRGM